jgi:hypothetical protein
MLEKALRARQIKPKISAGVMEQVNQGYPKSTSPFRRLRIDSPPLARSAPAASTR